MKRRLREELRIRELFSEQSALFAVSSQSRSKGWKDKTGKDGGG